ncbi:TPA: hypothetical protein IAC10_01265 [Candidatus Scatousia excrementigallinarum]|uniref:Uncharacterized protein n=1 Tax=Candidatus Scatousia excrementigallinarum TaxID=2840935 RepID=A0A9D1EWI2_9BACT|nr:hypothetical protein [Candidatus Scatousia excrementigallinarum]
MTKKEYILDSLIDDDEAFTQILEYFEFVSVDISEEELNLLLNEMINEGLIVINKQWTNEKNEFPYSLTKKGKELWAKMK